jgi:hypothetical protein
MEDLRARWESTLHCTRSDVVVSAILAIGLLVAAFLTLSAGTALALFGAGLAVGLVMQVANRTVLDQPLAVRRFDWDGQPPSPSVPRTLAAGFTVAAIGIAAAIFVVVRSDQNWRALLPYLAGAIAFAALAALLQRLLLIRDYARRLEIR